jgi:hypothetical protein
MAWELGWVRTLRGSGGARPDNELPGGGYVDNELPGMGGGAHPDNELPGGGAHVWGWAAKLIRWLLGPHIGGGPAGKPPGFPIISPPDPDWDIPVGPPHPWLPGHYVPVDPGYGQSPGWGWEVIDPGWGVGGRPGIDNTLPERPGHWVPVDGDYGKPAWERHCSGDKPKPKWLWIDHIGPDWGKPKPPAPAPKK